MLQLHSVVSSPGKIVLGVSVLVLYRLQLAPQSQFSQLSADGEGGRGQ